MATVDLPPQREGRAGLADSAALMDQCSLVAGWSSEAPGKLRKASDPAAYMTWLSQASRDTDVANLIGDGALGWGAAFGGEGTPAGELLELAAEFAGSSSSKLVKAKRRTRVADAVQQWRAWAKDGPDADDCHFALATLAAARLLPIAAGCCEADLWWDVLDALRRVAAKEFELVADTTAGMLCGQLLGVELPLTLAQEFPEIQAFRELGRVGRDRLATSAEELLNGEGLPHGAFVGSLLPLVACWTRLAATSRAMKKSPWSKFAKDQYAWLVRQALRWTAPGGQPLLAEAIAGEWSPAFIRAALQLGGDATDAAGAETLLGRKALGKAAGAAKTHEPPDAADHCEWAGLAVLRTNWSPQGTALAVDWTRPTMRLELRVGRRQIFAGVWDVALKLDGEAIEIAGEWEETCWFSDSDVDFLELSQELPEGGQLDRQLLLAREDMFLYAVDYWTLPQGQRRAMTYCAGLTLGGAVEFAGEAETRDGFLKVDEISHRVLPLGLAEWRSDPRGGELTADDGRLTLSANREGRVASAPLLIDLDAARSRKPGTWRQLTIAEGLEIKSPDVAIGYRAQSGKDQWLFYRSIAPRGNRTLLGQNTSSEFLAARFLADTGGIEELVEIEG